MKKLSFVFGVLIAFWGYFACSTVYGLDLMLLNGKVIKNCIISSISDSSVTVVVFKADGRREYFEIEFSAISREMRDICRASFNENILKDKFLDIGDELQADFSKDRTDSRYKKKVSDASNDIIELLEENAEDVTVEKILELSGGVLVRVIEVPESSTMIPGEMILICNIEAPEEDIFRCAVYNIFAVTDLDGYGVVKMYDFDIESAAVAIRKMISLQMDNKELFYPLANSTVKQEVLIFDPETEVEYVITKRGVTAIFVERGNRSRRRNIIRYSKGSIRRHGRSPHVRKPARPRGTAPAKNIPRVKPGKKPIMGNSGNPPSKVTPRQRPSRKPQSGSNPTVNRRKEPRRNLPNLPRHKYPGSTRPAKRPGSQGGSTIRREKNLRLPNLPRHKYPGSTRPTKRPGSQGGSTIRREENLRLPNLPRHKYPGSTRPR